MLNAFWWLLAAEAIGLAAFPLAYFLFPRLADRGYSVSKPLGLLVIGYLSWILSVLHVLPSVRASLLALLLAMGALSAWYAWTHRRELREFAVNQRNAIIVSEAIFLVFFVGWVIFRAYDPSIDHTEQPMDLAFLNASIRSEVGHPEDLWLSGKSVSYYYFGYWMMGVVSELTGVIPQVSYNLALALIPAMGAMGVFGLVYNVVSSDASRLRYAFAGGIAAAMLLGVVANLEGVLEFARANGMGSQGFWDWVRVDGLTGPAANPTQSWAPQEFWWWFRATRVINTFNEEGQGIDYTIQEFPFFSFMLGDLHPHVMSIPFVLLFLALCWNYLKSPVKLWRERGVQGYVSLLAIGLVLGGLAFTNMWDLPTFWALFLGVAALRAYNERDGRFWTLVKAVAPVGLAVLLLAAILYLPYFLVFRGGVKGIGATETATRPIHLFIVWGLFLAATAPFVVGVFWRTTVRSDWRRLTGLALAAGFVPYVVWAFMHLLNVGLTGELVGRFFRVLPFALLIGMAVYSALWLLGEEGQRGKAYAMLLAALGLLLIMGPDLLYVNDPFGPPSERMNTVFKLYYQAWIILAAASGFALYYWWSVREGLSGWRRWLTALWAVGFAALLIGSLYYPPAAATSKGELFKRQPTLDGLAFLTDARRAEYEAIKFLRQDADGGSAMVEAVGEWADAGLISRSAAVPTVFNWPGHQIQWRSSDEAFRGREQDVRLIYETQDVEEAKTLLDRYDVKYVYVGPRERQKYGVQGLDKFPAFMDAVFSQDDVVIYRLKQ
jgi:YYY domain-containing protein